MQTMTSEHARKGWGQLLDTILAGETVAIERHGRPAAVIVGPKQWEALARRLAELESQLAAIRRVDLHDEEPGSEQAALRAESRRVITAVRRGELETIRHEDLLAQIAAREAGHGANMGN